MGQARAAGALSWSASVWEAGRSSATGLNASAPFLAGRLAPSASPGPRLQARKARPVPARRHPPFPRLPLHALRGRGRGGFSEVEPFAVAPVTG